VPVVCGCETWSVTLREEGMLLVFENGVMKEMFLPRTGKLTGFREKITYRRAAILVRYYLNEQSCIQ
jgi:hypothetical protein